MGGIQNVIGAESLYVFPRRTFTRSLGGQVSAKARQAPAEQTPLSAGIQSPTQSREPNMGTTGPQTTSTTEPEKAGVETGVARPGARYLGELPSEARRRVVGRFMLIALVVNAVVLGVLLLQSSSDALPPQSSFDSGASPRIHWAQSGLPDEAAETIPNDSVYLLRLNDDLGLIQ